MSVVDVIGNVLRFLVRIMLLPVQAALTLILLAVEFLSGLLCVVGGMIGFLAIVAAIVELCSASGTGANALYYFIGGLCFAVIPQALSIWGEVGILGLKDFLARV